MTKSASSGAWSTSQSPANGRGSKCSQQRLTSRLTSLQPIQVQRRKLFTRMSVPNRRRPRSVAFSSFCCHRFGFFAIHLFLRLSFFATIIFATAAVAATPLFVLHLLSSILFVLRSKRRLYRSGSR